MSGERSFGELRMLQFSPWKPPPIIRNMGPKAQGRNIQRYRLLLSQDGMEIPSLCHGSCVDFHSPGSKGGGGGDLRMEVGGNEGTGLDATAKCHTEVNSRSFDGLVSRLNPDSGLIHDRPLTFPKVSNSESILFSKTKLARSGETVQGSEREKKTHGEKGEGERNAIDEIVVVDEIGRMKSIDAHPDKPCQVSGTAIETNEIKLVETSTTREGNGDVDPDDEKDDETSKSKSKEDNFEGMKVMDQGVISKEMGKKKGGEMAPEITVQTVKEKEGKEESNRGSVFIRNSESIQEESLEVEHNRNKCFEIQIEKATVDEELRNHDTRKGIPIAHENNRHTITLPSDNHKNFIENPPTGSSRKESLHSNRRRNMKEDCQFQSKKRNNKKKNSVSFSPSTLISSPLFCDFDNPMSWNSPWTNSNFCLPPTSDDPVAMIMSPASSTSIPRFPVDDTSQSLPIPTTFAPLVSSLAHVSPTSTPSTPIENMSIGDTAPTALFLPSHHDSQITQDPSPHDESIDGDSSDKGEGGEDGNHKMDPPPVDYTSLQDSNLKSNVNTVKSWEETTPKRDMVKKRSNGGLLSALFDEEDEKETEINNPRDLNFNNKTKTRNRMNHSSKKEIKEIKETRGRLGKRKRLSEDDADGFKTNPHLNRKQNCGQNQKRETSHPKRKKEEQPKGNSSNKNEKKEMQNINSKGKMMDEEKKMGNEKNQKECGLVRCKFYMEGRCSRGVECTFSHNFVPQTKNQICKFHLLRCCLKGDECPFSHELTSFPCRYFHGTGHCMDGSDCRFSHAELDERGREILRERMKLCEKEVAEIHGGNEYPIEIRNEVRSEADMTTFPGFDSHETEMMAVLPGGLKEGEKLQKGGFMMEDSMEKEDLHGCKLNAYEERNERRDRVASVDDDAMISSELVSSLGLFSAPIIHSTSPWMKKSSGFSDVENNKTQDERTSDVLSKVLQW